MGVRSPEPDAPESRLMGKARRAASFGGRWSAAGHQRNRWAKRQLLGGLSFGGGASRMSGGSPVFAGAGAGIGSGTAANIS